MKEYKVTQMWSRSLGLAFLLCILLAGCGRQQAISPVPPTVISTTPANGAVNVPLNSTITATFSSVMNPATLNTGSFTVGIPGGIAVAGTVSLVGNTATFTPASTLPANATFLATITTNAQDPGGNSLAANFSWTFSSAQPAVISTVPAAGATAVAINTLVTATFNEIMDAATINGASFTLQGPGVTPVAGVVSYSGTTATFTPAALLAPNVLYTATITTAAHDPNGNPLAANFVWTFTTDVSPTVTSTIPANGATAVAINTLVSATFSRAMDPTTINGTTFTVTGPGATPVAGTVTYAGTTATFTSTALFAAGTLFTATITTGAKDPTGSALAANFVWTFTTDVPPTVLSTTPVNGAINVAANTAPTATFSRAMDPATITATTFTLTGPGTTPVAGAVTYAGTTATFTPTTPLLFNTVYTATITTGAADPTGNALAANFVWTFMTVTLPAVTATDPANAATNVLINHKIIAAFNQPMNAATILAPGTFTVMVTTGGAAVAGVVTYDAPSNTAIFTPAADLAVNTQFTATITTAAQNPAGTALAANYVWSFTTGAAVDSTLPSVTLTDPVSGAAAVPLNQRVIATFSEAMDPATISAVGTVTLVTTIGAVPVAGTVTYNPASHTVVFTPAADLAVATQYTAQITAAAKDLGGNALIAGSVPNPWNFTTGAAANNVGPTITATSPANAAIAVPINDTVSATFSAAMDPTTINNATFAVFATLTGAPVDGLVSYDPASHIATFTPSANFANSTQYTATIASSVTDESGNALVAGAAPNPWSFTTGTTIAATPQPVNLGSASTFGSIGSSAGITNQGLLTVINGDIGTTGVSTLVTGFHDAGVGCTYTETPLNKGAVNGNIYTAAPPPTVGCPTEGTASTASIAAQALADANTAYNNLTPATLPGGTDPGAGQLGGLTLFPGIYQAAGGSFLITGSDLTLDAQNNPNAVWVFQMASTLSVGDPGTPRNVTLINGAQAKNVFWQVGSSATINGAGGGTVVGTIIAFDGVTFSTAGNVALTVLNGRALGLNASVTMVNTVINVPAP